jgi:hypothetical protein
VVIADEKLFPVDTGLPHASYYKIFKVCDSALQFMTMSSSRNSSCAIAKLAFK